MASTILIADDDPVQRRLLEAMIRRFGYETESVESGELALARLTASDSPPIALLVLDLVMPDLDGMGVLARMRDEKLQTPVIVETAHGSIEAVISAMRAGASDFVVKPVGAERLQISIKNALAADVLAGEVRRAARRAQGVLTFKDLVSRSAELARVIRLGERTAIDRHERLAAAIGSALNGARDDFLADARFALDQHRYGRTRGALPQPDDAR